MLLTSAKTAYNAKDFVFAAGRFREFLAKFPNHKDAVSAHYGLALALLDGPAKDYNAAVEQLQPLAGAKDAPDYPFYLYYLGLAERGQGVKSLAEIASKPNEAQQRKDFARGRFDEAAKQFAAAQAAFAARVKAPDPDAKDLPIDLEWAARAAATSPRCACGCSIPRAPATPSRSSPPTSSSPRAAITAWASITTASPVSSSRTTSPPAGR